MNDYVQVLNWRVVLRNTDVFVVGEPGPHTSDLSLELDKGLALVESVIIMIQRDYTPCVIVITILYKHMHVFIKMSQEDR